MSSYNAQSGANVTHFREDVEDSLVSFGGPSDLSPDGSVQESIGLSDWFTRPYPIKTYSWAEGASIDDKFFPWFEYFSQPAVLNKIKGYSRLKAKLKIKMVINASPYQYSALMASYKPLVAVPGSAYVADYSGGVTDSASSLLQKLIAYSQRPNIMLYPQVSNTSTIELPFIYPWNYLNLSASTLEEDLKSLGSIDLISFTDLLSASSSAGPAVNVVIFAWAEMIDLQGPAFELQSGSSSGGKEKSATPAARKEQKETPLPTSEDAEYKARPISTTASAIAAASSALSVVPVIGPYMRATSVIASRLGGLAAWFGFSNTAPVMPVSYTKIATNPNLANTQIGTATEKLAIDPKNELSVDPAIIGFSRDDELSMTSYCGKESFAYSTTWQISDAPGAVITQLYVSPDLFSSTGRTTALGANYNAVQMVPMCHAKSTFKYWRGPIKYRFQILASRFHRGRLRLSYDPNGSTSWNPLLQLNQVIDLATCTDFEFEVPYMAPESWKENTNLGLTLSSFGEIYSARGSPALPYSSDNFNGKLRLEVLSDLVSPTTTADVVILVYASAPELELAMPVPLPGPQQGCYELSPYDMYELQSGEDPEPLVTTSASVPQVSHDDTRSLVYMGERVFSLRELFKRTYYSYTLTPAAPVGSVNGTTMVTRVSNILPRFPRYPGRAVDSLGTNAIHVTAGSTPVNFVSFTPIGWLSMCFTGVRGAMVWRVQTPDVQAGNSLTFPMRSFITNTREVQSNDGVDILTVAMADGSTIASSSALNYEFSGHATSLPATSGDMTVYGTGSTLTSMEPTNIASVPLYSRAKFISANPLNVMRSFGPISHADDNVNIVVDSFTMRDNQVGFRSVGPPNDTYVSCGDDFTVAGFMAIPTVYRAPAVISSV